MQEILPLRTEAEVLSSLAAYTATFLDLDVGDGRTVGEVYRTLLRGGEGAMLFGGRLFFIDEVLREGRFLGPTDQLISGTPGFCHWNVYERSSELGCTDQAWSGFAFSRDLGIWVEHSWLTDLNGRVLETTAARDLYFGIPLSPSQLDALGQRCIDHSPREEVA